MRPRRIVPVLPLAAACWLLWVAPAGAAGPRIICPLVTSCCPLPVSAPVASIPCCSPPIAFCLTAPTIASSPDPSFAGRSVTVSGLIPGAASGTQVTLWQKLPGAASRQSVATTSTNSSGQYTFLLAEGSAQTNREWYVTASGKQSATVDQRVRAVVTLALTVKSGRHELAAHGHVSPSHAGQRVLLERKTARGFVVVARPLLSHSSSYSAVVPFSGTILVQTVLPGDQRNVRSVSNGHGFARGP